MTIIDPPAAGRALCDALRSWRIRARINQAVLARTLGVSQSQISRWESGRDMPRAHNAEAIRALVFGRDETQLAALIHFVQTSLAPLALFDADHLLVAASAPLGQDGAPFAHWRWLFDVGAHAAYGPVLARYRDILARPGGVVGLRIRVPFLLDGEPWLAQAEMTICATGGTHASIAEITFRPESGTGIMRPELEALSDTRDAVRLLRRRRIAMAGGEI